jgi:hypothetical protein
VVVFFHSDTFFIYGNKLPIWVPGSNKGGTMVGQTARIENVMKKGLSNLIDNPLFSFKKNGAEGQNRTADTGIFSPLLYRLSYLGILESDGYI